METKLNLFKTRKARTYQVIILSFLSLILVGAVLLCLPISSQAGIFTSFIDALFTAVSATCVTGLVVKDTATYWSLFGQLVILIMIQIGGMGVITVAIGIVRASGRKIGLWERSTMQEIMGASRMGGIIRLVGFIIKGAVAIEIIGVLLLMPVFCRDFGAVKGIWYSVFHSISAFCNAGFDLMGIRGPFSSFTSYRSDLLLNAVIISLIIIGGIGFMTWNDIREYKFKFKRYSLQSKIIFITSLILILIPAAYFFFFEYRYLPLSQRILPSLFQSVTTRTAGFNTSDLNMMDESGNFLMIILMLIGGSPGSTAGGMKTTTIAVLLLSAFTVFARKNDVQAMQRRISNETVRNAGAILFMYLVLFILGAMIISKVDDLPFIPCLFETASAIGTVGLTMGITTVISLPSKLILMILMFFGRVGGLTLIYAALPSDEGRSARMPLAKVTVG